MKSVSLFLTTALLEIVTGIALLISPVFVVRLLLGADISTETEITICRVGGSAILALGISCWLARNAGKSPAAKALTGGLLVYNIMVFFTLAYSAYTASTTPLLIVALVAHLALGIACMASLRSYK